MRRNLFRGACLLAAWLALAPAVGWGQSVDVAQYAPASPQIPLPYGSTRPEDGGLYLNAGYAMFYRNNPIHAQTVAVYGFRILDNSLPGVAPGTFIGSGKQALNTAQLTGADSLAPGTEMSIGWKFKDGSAVEMNWLYLSENHYRAGATLLPPNGAVGNIQQNTFLYADVYNIPPQFAGPSNKVNLPNAVATPTNPNNPLAVPPIPGAGSTFGIWNAASIMTIDFIQRFQQFEILYREPIYQTETYRLNGLVGPRYAWIWERFGWITTDIDDNTGQSGPQDAALYTNIVSNRMYGAVAGFDQEYYFGHGIVGQLKIQGAMYLDSAKEIAKFQSLARYIGMPENKRSQRVWSIVPELDVSAGIMWYPTEFVQIYAAYEVMAFWNTIAAAYPLAQNTASQFPQIDYSNLNPHWSHVGRVFNGFRCGITFTF